jgi:quercetin dioxygenase-like cupin family protein
LKELDVITLDGEDNEYTKGETVLIPQGVKHRIENKDQKRLFLLKYKLAATLEKMI